MRSRTRTIAILIAFASLLIFTAALACAQQRRPTWGQILIVGGHYDNTAELYDPVSNRFAPEPSTPRMKDRGRSTATLLVTGPNAGKVLIAGGDNRNNVARASTELYDPATNTVVPGPAMHTPRSGHFAAVIGYGPNAGKILIAGGLNAENETLSSTELYDPAANAFLPGPRMAATCALCPVTVIRSGKNAGKMLISGYYDPHSGGGQTELYDPATNKFLAGPKTKMLLVYTATTIPSGKNADKILIVGAVDVASVKDVALTELYDPTANKFVPGPAMREIREDHTATVITSGPNSGKILIAGGEHSNSGTRGGGASLASTELYDPGTNSFAPGPPMNTPRVAHTATVIRSGKNAGKILIAGGIQKDVDKDGRGILVTLSSTELYDPVTNKFAPPADTPKMNEPRFDTVAVQLPPAPPTTGRLSRVRKNG
ncbi:MAG: Kelch repeat-containing protein [Candidatus Binataceae bacterium]